MIAANVSGNVMTSDDFGVTWGPENDLGILGWGAVDGSSNHATLVAAPFFGDLYISHDTGVTWAPDVGIPNVGWSDVAVSANGNFIVAVGGGHNIWTSYDGGTTWTEQPGSGSRAWNSVAISQTTNRVVAIDKGGMIYVSDDAGVTWSPEVSLDGGVWLEAAISSDGRTAAVVAPGAKIFIGTDPDEDAPVISSIHTELSGTMATITWNTNELASSQVVYGNTPSYGTTTTISDVTPRVLNHTVVLSNLPTCRTYHFAIVTQDAAQNTTTSTDQTFSIGGCPQSGSGGGSGSRSGGTTSVSSAGTQDNVVAIIKANSALLTNAYKAGFVLPLWIRNILGLNTSAAPSVWQSDLQLGSTGAGVTWLQQFLIDQKIGPAALALGKHGTTNLFGVLTKSALIEWQVAHNIQPAQGYYGPRTRASMQ
jgi:hypothetical protein